MHYKLNIKIAIYKLQILEVKSRIVLNNINISMMIMKAKIKKNWIYNSNRCNNAKIEKLQHINNRKKD